VKYLIYITAILTGLLLGQLFFASKAPNQSKDSDLNPLGSRTERSRRPHDNYSQQITEALLNESSVFDKNVSFKDAEAMLTKNRSSPIRHASFLAHRVHLMSSDQLIEALKLGNIQTHSELAEAAKRLTEENPHLLYDLYEQHKIRCGGLEHYYTFSNSMMRTWIKKDPVSLLGRIKKLKRGGAQQDASLRFSRFWAQHAPATAAQKFSDLVYLRNLSGRGSSEFTGTAYARDIVNSWHHKDPEALTAFIKDLPPGQQKTTFEQALKKINPKKE